MILIFGTSITYGMWDEEGGWAERIKRLADQKTIASNFENEVLVYPLGISGNNTDRLSKRFEIEVEARKSEEADLQIIIDIGINDSYYFNAENKNCVPLKNYEENLLKIIDKSKRYSADLIFVGLTPVDERVNPVPWEKEISFRIETVKKYDEALKNLCKENNIPFIDILSKFMETDCKNLLADGLHPNTKGHEFIYNEVKTFLKEKSYI